MTLPVHGDTLGDLVVILHEALHAALWDLDEQAVDEISTDAGRLLWRLDWRKEV